jgi:LacI family transcriptional regulator
VAAEGLAVVLCDSAERADRERRYLELLEEQRVQGILITPVEGVGEQLRQLRRRGIPVVLVDRWASTRSFCSVSVDDVYGGELAATHLVDRGHTRIAFVGGPSGSSRSPTATRAPDASWTPPGCPGPGWSGWRRRA